jgi:hypothetical protein
MLMPVDQELDIECDFSLKGPGLEVLPRCCPSLKALRLRQLMDVTDCFLPVLQHLAVCLLTMMQRKGDKSVLVCLQIQLYLCCEQHVLSVWSPQMQDLVELELSTTPLNSEERCALAVHIPSNLTTLSLQYMPDGWWSSYVEIVGERKVCQQASGAEAPATLDTMATTVQMCTHYRMCFHTLHGMRAAHHNVSVASDVRNAACASH